jgi:two-component system nitrogen regulation sensor histidine kinase GlnL
MTILEELETAVVELDPANRIQLMNGAAEQCLAARRDRLLNLAIEQLEHWPPELQEALVRTREDQRTRRLPECRMGGGWYDCNVRLLDNDHLLLEFYDLAWAQQQQQLQQREVQTGLLDLLRRNLGHEIRSPLGGIRGAAQMMAAELEEQELGTLARLIMREVDRIDELIKRFWEPEHNQAEVDVHRVLEESLEVLTTEGAVTAHLVRDYDPSIPPVRGDSSALRRVFINLVRNAQQAGAGTITLRTRIEHGSALLQRGRSTVLRVDVEDDGDGVPESLRPLLFLPMVTGRRDGTGLGLALAQQIAAAHGGLVTYEPQHNGTQFCLRLPVSDMQENNHHE